MLIGSSSSSLLHLANHKLTIRLEVFFLIWLEHLFCLHQSPDSSFTGGDAAVEEELQELKNKLRQEEANSRGLQERLLSMEQQLQEKESAHTEQVTMLCHELMMFKFHDRALPEWFGVFFFCLQLRKLQAVVCEKDVRFQEQIQKHEEELLRVSAQSQNDEELQQVHPAVLSNHWLPICG